MNKLSAINTVSSHPDLMEMDSLGYPKVFTHQLQTMFEGKSLYYSIEMHHRVLYPILEQVEGRTIISNSV